MKKKKRNENEKENHIITTNIFNLPIYIYQNQHLDYNAVDVG